MGHIFKTKQLHSFCLYPNSLQTAVIRCNISLTSFHRWRKRVKELSVCLFTIIGLIEQFVICLAESLQQFKTGYNLLDLWARMLWLMELFQIQFGCSIFREALKSGIFGRCGITKTLRYFLCDTTVGDMAIKRSGGIIQQVFERFSQSHCHIMILHFSTQHLLTLIFKMQLHFSYCLFLFPKMERQLKG